MFTKRESGCLLDYVGGYDGNHPGERSKGWRMNWPVWRQKLGPQRLPRRSLTRNLLVFARGDVSLERPF
jgi:hypothetical protein